MPPTSLRIWRGRLLRFLAGAGATLITALAGAARNKWVALHLDTAGIGIVAQVISAQSWIGNLAGLGVGIAVSRAVGARAGSGDDNGARRSVWTGLSLVAPTAVAAALLGVAFAPRLSALLLGTSAHADLVRVSMLGVMGIGLYQVIQGAAAGRSDVRAPYGLAVGGVALAAAATFLLVPRFGLLGATLAIALAYPAACLATAALHARRYPGALARPEGGRFDRVEARSLLSVSGAALLLPLADQGVFLALRTHFLRAHGVEANGLLQAAVALSQQVGALFYAYLAAYAFGKISGVAAAQGAPGVQAYTRRHWTPLVLLAAAVFAVSIVVASPLLHLLYSSRFDPARPMMACALFGEFGRVCLQIVALGSLPLGGTRLWFRIGITQPIVLAAAYALLVAGGAGALALPLAYAGAGVITFVAGTWMMARAGVRLDARRLGITVLAYAALGLLVRVVI
ncbi:MAG: MATE family efflux transporter [Bacteroidota bacterium]